MSPQLAALFAAHKTAILGGAAVGVLALSRLRKKGTAAAAPAATAVAGAIPAAAVVPSQGAGGAYDSSAYDVYNALQSELGPILQQQANATGTGGITTAPAPVASTLFAPTRSGNYVSQTPTNGAPMGVFEVESDGSLYHLTSNDWGSISDNGKTTATSVAPNLGSPFYSLEGNLSAANHGTGPSTFTTNAQGNFVPYVPKS